VPEGGGLGTVRNEWRDLAGWETHERDFKSLRPTTNYDLKSRRTVKERLFQMVGKSELNNLSMTNLDCQDLIEGAMYRVIDCHNTRLSWPHLLAKFILVAFGLRFIPT
jgi:hypothetical protein